MLIQFNFENYKSFKDKAILDLTAAKMKEYSDRIVSVAGEKLLPVAAIYGANASGKSNVYRAFKFMADYVIQSFNYGDEEDSYKYVKAIPFLFSNDSELEDSCFEVYFTVPGDKTEKEYNYGFCIGKNGITEEWLNSKAKTARKFSPVFYREESTATMDLSGLPKESRENIEIALESQALIVSLGAKLKVGKCKLVRDWFLGNRFSDFGNDLANFILSNKLPKDFVTDAKVREDVVKFLSSFDETIKDFHIEKVPAEEDGKENRYKVTALHKKIGSDHYAEIPLREESSGTLKMFSLYQGLKDVLQNGGVYFIDELNARLHPLLVRNFILSFLNPEMNTKHAQLIFTTHDTWQLSNQLLRRDEIWFTDKDKNGVSSLYSLADFVDDDGSRIRKDESYEKNYLIGKYGAIPGLKSFDFVEEV